MYVYVESLLLFILAFMVVNQAMFYVRAVSCKYYTLFRPPLHAARPCSLSRIYQPRQQRKNCPTCLVNTERWVGWCYHLVAWQLLSNSLNLRRLKQPLLRWPIPRYMSTSLCTNVLVRSVIFPRSFWSQWKWWNIFSSSISLYIWNGGQAVRLLPHRLIALQTAILLLLRLQLPTKTMYGALYILVFPFVLHRISNSWYW